MTYIRYLGEEKPSLDDLAHFGVKGMHWGVRRAKRSAEKADKKWEKKATGNKAFIQAHNAAASRMNRTEINRINNKPQYKNKDFTNDSPLRRRYYKEFNDTFNRIMVEEHRKVFGSNPSGTKQLGLVKGPDGEMTIGLVDVKHADGDPDIRVKFDERGYIVSVQVSPAPVTHSEDLEHFGVKGMHWGVRKASLPVHTGYSKKEQFRDAALLGKGSVKRINARMHKGESLKDARKAETRRAVKITAGIAGAYIAAKLISTYGPVALQGIAQRAETNRGKAAALKMLETSLKPKLRGGVYKITTM